MGAQFSFCLISEFWTVFFNTHFWTSLPFILYIPYIQHWSLFLGFTHWLLLLPVGKNHNCFWNHGNQKAKPQPRRIWPLMLFVLCTPPGLLIMSSANSPECTYMPSVQSQESVPEPQEAKTEAGWMKRGRINRALLLITPPLGQRWCPDVKQPFPTSTKFPI